MQEMEREQYIMNIHFYGLNFYSKQPQVIFDFYKALGFRVVQGKEQSCCNNLYFTTNGKVEEIYENIKAAGIDCPEPIKTFWGGTELTVTDPDGNTILFL